MSKTLPKSLEWYADGSKWLVAIATGAIVFGFGLMKDLKSIESFSQTVFTLSSISFVIVCISGVRTFFFISSYADITEHLNSVNWRSIEREKIESVKKVRNEKLNRSYQIMMYSFSIGILLFSIFGLSIIYNSDKKGKNSYSITSLKKEGNNLLLSNSSNGQFWLLSQDSTGSFQIKEVFKIQDQKEK